MIRGKNVDNTSMVTAADVPLRLHFAYGIDPFPFDLIDRKPGPGFTIVLKTAGGNAPRTLEYIFALTHLLLTLTFESLR